MFLSKGGRREGGGGHSELFFFTPALKLWGHFALRCPTLKDEGVLAPSQPLRLPPSMLPSRNLGALCGGKRGPGQKDKEGEQGWAAQIYKFLTMSSHELNKCLSVGSKIQ